MENYLAISHQVAIKLGTFSIEAREGSPVGGAYPKIRKQNQRQTLLLLLGVLHVDHATKSLNICIGSMFLKQYSLLYKDIINWIDLDK